MIYTFMADGCEEIEALAVVDLLRRAGLETVMVSIHEKEYTTGAHDIVIRNDTMLSAIAPTADDLLFLPGGGVGTKNLKACEKLSEMLKTHAAAGGRLAAICAAPSALGVLGLLEGKRATSYPGFEDQLKGAVYCTDPVVTDGSITTSRGMGTAILLGLELVSLLKDEETAKKLGSAIMMP
ncbi:MAG: DJ-1/PfpI family protein [Lachnospiraceae bacterium]|nr:DJ-1/PfpI family protein [Lachnospiraceae bacterium]